MKKVIEIKEDVKIVQEGHDIILEKGDRIEVLSEMYRRFSVGTYKYTIVTGPGKSVSADDSNYSFSSDNPEPVNIKQLTKHLNDSFEIMSHKGLAEYIRAGRGLENVVSILPPIPCDRNGRVFRGGDEFHPYLLWTVYTEAELDSRAEKLLLEYLEGQLADGWGEGFEQHPVDSFETKDYEKPDEEFGGSYYTRIIVKVFYSPWQNKNWTAKIIKKGLV